MANKRKTPKKKRVSKQTGANKNQNENDDDLIAQTILHPTVQAAATLHDYGKSYNRLDIFALVDSLTEQVKAVIGGDSDRCEEMLASQAHTLDSIFNNLARRAINAEYMNHMDTYLKLALRAQSQCRATWETLSTIKNPPMVGYVRQANIAHGPQQVNNAPSTTSEDPRARENPNLQNKLLEEKDGEQLDTGTTGTASRTDPAMATLGTVDRAEDAGR